MLRHWRIILFLTVLLALGFSALPVLPSDAALSLRPVTAPAQPAPKPASLKRATGCVYWIQRGDNLFRIGLRYGVSYTYLALLNGIPNPNLIFAGTSIAVPCGGSAVPAMPQNCAPSESYTVVAGDNLFRIAYNYKTALEWVRSVNNMYGRVLRPGMVLTIPCPGSVQYREVPPPGEQPPPPGETPTEVPPTEAAPTPTPPPGTEILIQGRSFNPQTLVVIPGTTVIWTNQDTQGHTIVVGSQGNQFARSPLIPPGGSWWFQFNDAGTYDFSFAADPTVNGSLTVRNP